MRNARTKACDRLDSVLTRVRNALASAGVPDQERYPSTPFDSYEASLQAGGRAIQPDEQVQRLVADLATTKAALAKSEEEVLRMKNHLGPAARLADLMTTLRLKAEADAQQAREELAEAKAALAEALARPVPRFAIGDVVLTQRGPSGRMVVAAATTRYQLRHEHGGPANGTWSGEDLSHAPTAKPEPAWVDCTREPPRRGRMTQQQVEATDAHVIAQQGWAEGAAAGHTGAKAVPLISQRDAEAETAKLRALLVEARDLLGHAAPHETDAAWLNAHRAWRAALAETEGAT